MPQHLNSMPLKGQRPTLLPSIFILILLFQALSPTALFKMQFSHLSFATLISLLFTSATAQDLVGWSVAFYNDDTCSTPSLNTTSSDSNYFTCQPAGPGFYTNGTFAAIGATADDYCHIQFYSDLACKSELGDPVNSGAISCHIVNPPAMAYSVSCYR